MTEDFSWQNTAPTQIAIAKKFANMSLEEHYEYYRQPSMTPYNGRENDNAQKT